jgi:xanthine dehydrogenase YagS FAD-binding subunit
MHPFTYTRDDDATTAVEHVRDDAHARFLAGGTTLIDLMKLNVETPTRLVDINHVPLTRIEPNGKGGLRIGALVSNTDLAYHHTVRTLYPVLSEALLSGATPQLRNMATVGGNLLQRTRCTYFRDAYWPCNKRQPGAGCSAIDGYNHSHAILGTSEQCIATHPSDMCVALVALDAVVHTQGPVGERSIPIAEFHVAYGEEPAKESVLEHGELITAVELPAVELFRRSHYLKVRDRAAFEFALVSVAAALDMRDGKIAAARIALGGVATKPWRSHEAEQALVGAAPGEATYAAAANAALRNARPQKHNAFKIELARRAIVRALTVVEGMA